MRKKDAEQFAPRFRASRWGAAPAICLSMSLMLYGAYSADSSPSEVEIKAAFVLNFVRLVKWDVVAGEANPSELAICTLGNSDFASALQRVAGGKGIGTRSIVVRVNPNPDVLRCRVLVVDASQYPIARPILRDIRTAPVLTIGNGPGLLAIGGMFELLVEDHRVQFDASLEAIQRAGLDVSARLLQLSRNLRKGPNAGL